METQTKPAPPKVVVAPEGGRQWLTAGKEYRVIGLWDDWDERYGYGFSIIDDWGIQLDCIEKRCKYLYRNNWIIKEREGSHE